MEHNPPPKKKHPTAPLCRTYIKPHFANEDPGAFTCGTEISFPDSTTDKEVWNQNSELKKDEPSCQKGFHCFFVQEVRSLHSKQQGTIHRNLQHNFSFQRHPHSKALISQLLTMAEKRKDSHVTPSRTMRKPTVIFSSYRDRPTFVAIHLTLVYLILG